MSSLGGCVEDRRGFSGTGFGPILGVTYLLDDRSLGPVNTTKNKYGTSQKLLGLSQNDFTSRLFEAYS
jgi:hypothetical protein